MYIILMIFFFAYIYLGIDVMSTVKRKTKKKKITPRFEESMSTTIYIFRALSYPSLVSSIYSLFLSYGGMDL